MTPQRRKRLPRDLQDRTEIEGYAMKCIRRSAIASRHSLQYIKVLSMVQKVDPKYAKEISLDQIHEEINQISTRLNELLARFEEGINAELEPIPGRRSGNDPSLDISKIDFFAK